MAPGAEVPCAVQSAQDFDTYTKTINGVATKTYAPDGPLTYKWSADKGRFKDGPDGQSVIWIAPDDVTGPTPINIKCTIDDPDGPRVSAPDTGTHDDAAVVRTCRVLVKVPIVEFSGELVSHAIRACAGGFDDHDASSFQYRAHTRKVNMTLKFDDKPLPATKFILRFTGNKGHDYGDGRKQKTARLHKADAPFDDYHPWQESLELKSDGAGRVSVWVLSSDVINQPKLQALLKPLSPNAQPVVIGEIGCDFAAPIRYRRFDNPYDPDEREDRGWIFDFPHLVDPDNKEKLTPAKLYLKFQKFPDKGDDYTFVDPNGLTQGNWQFVNGHDVKMFIAQVDLLKESGEETTSQDREITGTPEELRRYAFVNLERTASQDSVAQRASASQGETTPQVYVKAGTDIKKVKTIWVDAQDLSVWKD